MRKIKDQLDDTTKTLNRKMEHEVNLVRKDIKQDVKLVREEITNMNARLDKITSLI